MSEFIKNATDLIEQGHVRVGTEVVKDPAFLVSRTLEDFVTWVDSSKIRRHVMEYNNMVSSFDLLIRHQIITNPCFFFFIYSETISSCSYSPWAETKKFNNILYTFDIFLSNLNKKKKNKRKDKNCCLIPLNAQFLVNCFFVIVIHLFWIQYFSLSLKRALIDNKFHVYL